MAGLFRTIFKGKKSRKENENDDDYTVFNPCVRSMSLKRQPTARFADDCMLPPTAAYHTTSAPKLRKGPQSCPGGRDDFNAAAYSRSNKLPRTFPLGASSSSRQDFQIDDFERGSRNHKIRESSSMEFAKRDQKEGDDEDNEAMLERKSRYYMQKWENSEKQRREERRKQERYEQERESIQSVMSNMAYCMASAQQLEQLKKERDQYKKEMRRYKAKCEQLESKCEQLQTMSPSYGAFQSMQNLQNPMLPSPFQTPQFPAPRSFAYPNPPLPFHRSMDFLNSGPPSYLYNENLSSLCSSSMSHTPTTNGSDGAGESLVNPSDVSFLKNFSNGPTNSYDNDDEDEVKNYRQEQDYFVSSPQASNTN
ncbi:BZIP domain-containing protein [Caenorhabditis elegans]|uniref:BZIP domain-containing protein n=1 Tax=Caenorhabditis elegans TaxID=6239 RepID=O16393_CAEEL|nr:BZIP domain-containing protein [Caenorhabditis elegans]CCD64869.1 BZIP domain-containing protein [Caenorhabditis elegans]|eukprot:NP_504075.1 Uncharacterized protein CELE_C17E7.4 [Caenorhabditis elegans]